MNQQQVAHGAKVVLQVVGAAGLIASALVAPNVLQALYPFVTSNTYKRKYPFRLTRVMDRLRARNLIQLTKQHGKAFYQITEKGRQVLARYVLQETKLPHPKKWDMKWRLLLFDIAETRKPTRENIRRSLERLGLTRLHDSVWMYPYACEDVVELLRTSYGVRYDVVYLTCERFWGDLSFLETYGLERYREV